MSVRADDAVAAAHRAQGFSLRDALGGFVGSGAEAAPRALRMAPPLQAMSHGSHGAVRTTERAGLRFSLSALREPTGTAAGPPRPVRAPAGLRLRVQEQRAPPTAAVAALPREQLRPFSASALGIAPQAPRAPTPVSAGAGAGAIDAPPTSPAPLAPAPAPAPVAAGPAHRNAAGEASRADVMRLTAYVDDLTTRLHSTQNKLDATERHLTRTSQALAVERQAATAKINALHRDVSTSKEREDRLKAELSTRPPKPGLNTAKFASSVESALAGEGAVKVYSTQLAELEEKVKALAAAKQTLATEVETLTTKRSAAETAAQQALTRSEQVKSTAAELEAGLKSAQASIVDAETKAEERRAKARELLAKAVELETSAAARVARAGGLDLLMDDAPEARNGGDVPLEPTAAAPPATPAPPTPAQTAVEVQVETAAPAPAPAPAVPRVAWALSATARARLPSGPTVGAGLGAHPAYRVAHASAPLGALAHDAPLALALAPTGDVVAQPTPDPSSDLVSAVIQDLKEHFLQIKGERQPHAHRVAPLVK